MFEAVIFDLDGVIINSIETMRKAFALAYAEVVSEGPPPFNEYIKHLGMSLKQIMNVMKLPEEMIIPYVNECNKYIDNIGIYPGISYVLNELKSAKIKLGVATGKEGQRARDLLKKLKILDYFGLVVGGDEVLNAKPDPEIIIKHLICFKTNVENTIFIGDSPIDILAGKKAKVVTAAALWGYGGYQELLNQKPRFWLNKPEELLNILF
jgi:AHBA synthesis associated protein